MQEERKSVLVTGGAGYIGSHACKLLAASGFPPVVFDNLENGFEKLVRWGPLERGDLLDRAVLDAVFERHRPHSVMHFAGLIRVEESVADPAKYYRNNVVGSLTLLEAMRDHGVRRLVFSSSCAVYGAPEAVPIGEDAPQAPINPYGNGKMAVERMLRDFDAAHGVRSVSLRYFNAAGADPEGESGELHDPETHALPLAIAAAQDGGPAFRIFGTDYPTPDGTALRDYVHVSDIASAHLLALDYLEAGGETAAFNLGTGAGTSVKELVEAVETVSGRPLPVEIAPRREGDSPVLVADAERARAVLGWRPAFTEFEGIVETAWRWHGRRRG